MSMSNASHTEVSIEPSANINGGKPEGKIGKYFKELKKDIFRDRILYYLLIPFLLWFLVFKYLPMWGIQIAFKDFSLFKGIGGSKWVGFEYFTEFIGSEYFLRVFKNTVIISLYGLIICFPAQIILDIMISEVTRQGFKKVVQTLTYLPHFVSVVVIAGIVTTFLSPDSGLINLMLEKLGFEKIYFLTNPDYFRGIYTIMNLWKETGFASIVFIAAIAGIDTQLYEAAKMDGANRWHQLRHITIPAIKSTIVVLFILRLGTFLDSGFEQIFLMLNSLNNQVGDVFDTYVYEIGILQGQFSYSAAVGLFKSAVALILVIGADRIAKKLGEDGII